MTRTALHQRHLSRAGLAALAALVAALFLLTTAPTARAAVTPPAGHGTYVVALMRNVGTESFVRLAQYSLRSDGSARADYWAWNAQTLQPRADSGFTTSGCATTCRVWTTNGFQSAPQQMYGVWSVSGSSVSITWNASSETERWTFTNLVNITKLDLASHPRATDGFGWGSIVGITTGVSASEIFAAHGTYSGPGVENNYGTVKTYTNASQTIHREDINYPVRLCNSTCMNLSTYNGTTPSNKVYLAGSGTDRKMFYNHQLFGVNPDPCIGGGSTVGAGHLKPSLQIIDDTGAFRGLIVAEASLYDFAYGSNILGIYDLNDI